MKVLLLTLNSLSAHFYEEFAEGEDFLEPVDFFSQYTLPYRWVRSAQVLPMDSPGDKTVIIIHKDQPVPVPIQFLDGSEVVLFLVDPVIPGYGVIVEQRFGNLQAALGEPVLDGFIAETICWFWFRSENLAKVGCVEQFKHFCIYPSNTAFDLLLLLDKKTACFVSDCNY
jgi:hypothetical protein